MIESRKQVRICAFLFHASLCFALSVAFAPLAVAQNYKSGQPVRQVEEKTVSGKGFLESFKGYVSGFFEDDKQDKKKEEPKSEEPNAPAKQEPESKKESDSGVIKAKRTDIGSDLEDKAPPEPYKVYNSTLLDAPTANYKKGIELEAPADEKNLSAPPALPEDVREEFMSGKETFEKAVPDKILPRKEKPLSKATQKAERAQEEAEEKKESALPQPATSVPSAAALPKQFFPIFSRHMTKDSQPQLLPVASNTPIEAVHPTTKRAIIFVHDIQRNVTEGVTTLMTLAGPTPEGDPLILAPQFSLQIDIDRFAKYLPGFGRTVARWSLTDPWQWGGMSVIDPRQPGISSFTAMDLLLLYLSDQERFPALEQVIIAGHGLGADFVQRYAALGQAPDVLETMDIVVRFIVANPSSYMYMTAQRASESGHMFRTANKDACPKILDYPYGTDELPDYGRKVGLTAVRLRYPSRRILYMVGDSVFNDNYLDNSCQALAQGMDRMQRGKIFARYIEQTFGELVGRNQLVKTIPNAGYDMVPLFGSPCGMAVLFGTDKCEGEERY